MKLALPSRLGGSLALRVALASVLFGLVVAGGTVAVGVWNLSRQTDERAGMEMQGRRELLTHIMSTIPSVAAVGASKDRFNHLFFGHADLHLALVESGSTKVLAGFSDTATHFVTMLSHARAPPGTLHAWVAPGGRRFSGWHGTVRAADGHEVGFYLSIGQSMDTALSAGFIKAPLLTLPLLLAMVAFGAGLIARTGLAPVRNFNRLAASNGTKSLDQRLSPANLPSELADMAIEFNGAATHRRRLPAAEGGLRRSGTRNADPCGHAAGTHPGGAVLSALIGDMLFIARADHDGSLIRTEAVDLVLEALRVADYLSLVAVERGVQIHVQGQASLIAADRLLVQRAITNLVSNERGSGTRSRIPRSPSRSVQPAPKRCWN